MDHDDRLLDPEVQALVGAIASKLARSARFYPLRVDDLQQELFLRLLEAAPCFDPARATWRAFAMTVLYSKAKSLYRDAGAARRAGRPVSFDAHDGYDGRQLEPAVDDDQDRADRRLDVASLLALVSTDLRLVAEKIMRGLSQDDIARDLQVSRYAVRGRMDRLARFLNDLGCARIENPPTVRARSG